MAESFDGRPLVGNSHLLPDGLRVRLRLARTSDAERIRHLVARHCPDLEELQLARLARLDPRTRIVVCASALIGSAETVVAIGAIDFDADAPDVVCVDPAAGEGLEQLLRGALVDRARAISSRRAA